MLLPLRASSTMGMAHPMGLTWLNGAPTHPSWMTLTSLATMFRRCDCISTPCATTQSLRLASTQLAVQIVEQFVQDALTQASVYPNGTSVNIMFTMGSDFNYENAYVPQQRISNDCISYACTRGPPCHHCFLLAATRGLRTWTRSFTVGARGCSALCSACV